MTDPYQVLGVAPDASDEEITKAYRALARKYHPDVNPGDQTAERKMKEINAAYEQIRDLRSGKAQNPGQTTGRGPTQNPGGAFYGWGPFGPFYYGYTSNEHGEQNQNHSSPRPRKFSIGRVVLFLILLRIVTSLLYSCYYGYTYNRYRNEYGNSVQPPYSQSENYV